MRSFLKILLLTVVFFSCKNSTTPPATNPASSVIVAHKYWVSKAFNDALFANTIVDTLSNLLCSELIFKSKDTLLLTSCLSDAGLGVYKVTGPNTLDITFEGFEGPPSKAVFDEKTGVLYITSPGGDTGWPTDFVAQDGIDISNLDQVTIALGRKRLAGHYSYLTKKGEVAVASESELRLDGTQANFGDFDTYEPWPSGIGGGFIQNPQLNLMYFVKKGKEQEPDAVAWQVHGDTLRIWDTKNIAPEGDMQEYKIKGAPRTYLKLR